MEKIPQVRKFEDSNFSPAQPQGSYDIWEQSGYLLRHLGKGLIFVHL